MAQRWPQLLPVDLVADEATQQVERMNGPVHVLARIPMLEMSVVQQLQVVQQSVTKQSTANLPWTA